TAPIRTSKQSRGADKMMASLRRIPTREKYGNFKAFRNVSAAQGLIEVMGKIRYSADNCDPIFQTSLSIGTKGESSSASLGDDLRGDNGLILQKMGLEELRGKGM
ncbi:hypothetical protein SK128_004011, partial [Halocaridina rubra]